MKLWCSGCFMGEFGGLELEMSDRLLLLLIRFFKMGINFCFVLIAVGCIVLNSADAEEKGKISLASSSTCLLHDKCLDELRKFTQADEFHVYTSLEEAEKACSDAKDAYLCVQSAPDCRDATEKAALSPLIRGSYRLLNDFCGFRSKRRPCCALRSAYLEYSECYVEVNDRLNDCNEKYRKSLVAITTLQDEYEQMTQRFCSVKWFGNCVRKATQSYCGKKAAQIIRKYVMKAGKPEKTFMEEKENCHENIYGYAEGGNNSCEPRPFIKCQIHLSYLSDYLAEDRLEDDEIFLSLCTGFHDSLECLNRAYDRCLRSKYPQIFENGQENSQENNACIFKENVYEKYKMSYFCLTSKVRRLTQCEPEVQILKADSTVRPKHYNKYFCRLLKKLERCWIDTASSYCGHEGKRIMYDIIQMAGMRHHQSCGM